MSEVMGPLAFGKKEEAIFLGREMAQHQDYSEQTAIEIDSEVRRIVSSSYEHAVALLKGHLQALHDLSAVLLDRETVSGDDVARVLRACMSDGLPGGGETPA